MPVISDVDQMAELAGRYEIRDAGEVRAFLASRPGLTPILGEAPHRIATAFPRPYQLRLQVLPDPDAPGLSELHVAIISQMDSDADWEAADVGVRRLHDEWLKRLPRDVTRDLLISAEPR